MSQDIEVAVIGLHFEPGVLRPIPPIDNGYDSIFMLIDPKANRPFISFVPRITFHLHSHADNCKRINMRLRADDPAYARSASMRNCGMHPRSDP